MKLLTIIYKSGKRALIRKWWIGFCALAASCASVVAPSGGDKDTDPPKLLSSTPANSATQMQEKTITLYFDEYVHIKSTTQIITSPVLSQPATFKVKKKSIIIMLPDSLKENTTYNIQFGNTIADINEGNTLPGFSYSFSTGAHLDTLSIKGRVVDAISAQPVEGVSVMLYESDDDSMPYKSLPSYISLTTKDGEFSVNNIADKSFRLFALKDKNANYLYDSRDELIGFENQRVRPTDSLLTIRLFKEEASKQKILKTYTEFPGKVVVIFDKPVADVRLTQASGVTQNNFIAHMRYGLQRDTLTAWITDTTVSEARLLVYDEEALVDTIDVLYRKEAKTFGKDKFSYQSNISADNMLDLPGHITFKFYDPVITIDTSRMTLRATRDSSQKKFSFKAEDFNLDLKLDFDAKENEAYELTILPGAFTNLYGLQNDTINKSFVMRNTRDYGTVTFKITVEKPMGGYVLQLQDFKGGLLTESRFTRDTTFIKSNISPGGYSMRVVYDANENGKWDTGNYFVRKQPEAILLSPAPVTIRANWDLDLPIKIPSSN